MCLCKWFKIFKYVNYIMCIFKNTLFSMTECISDFIDLPIFTIFCCSLQTLQTFFLVFMPELSVHVSEFPYMNSDTSLFVLLPAILSDTWMIKRNITDADICELVHRLSSNRATWQLRNVLRSKPTENNGIV